MENVKWLCRDIEQRHRLPRDSPCTGQPTAQVSFPRISVDQEFLFVSEQRVVDKATGWKPILHCFSEHRAMSQGLSLRDLHTYGEVEVACTSIGFPDMRCFQYSPSSQFGSRKSSARQCD
jgi:hypothetical protein